MFRFFYFYTLVKRISMLKYIGVLLLCVGCSLFKTDPPYDVANHIEKTVVQKWQSSTENYYTLTISIYLKDSLPKGITLSNLYYNNQISSLTKKDHRLFIATFEGILFAENQLHADPVNEYGNKAPSVVVPPVKIKDNEALLSYWVKGKEKSEILSKLTLNPVIVYPGVRDKPKN